MAAGALLMNMNRVSETDAVLLEARMMGMSKDIAQNTKENLAQKEQMKDMTATIRSRWGFMKDTGDVVDYTCERITGCMERYGPLKIPN